MDVGVRDGTLEDVPDSDSGALDGRAGSSPVLSTTHRSAMRVVAGVADPGTCDVECGTAGVSDPGYNDPALWFRTTQRRLST